MRAIRVVVADGGLVSRSDIVLMCEQAHLEVVGEAVTWDAVADLARSRAADIVLVCGDPDFARQAPSFYGATVVLAPDAAAAKEYADSGAFAVITSTLEPEMIGSIISLAVARAADLARVQGEADKLRDQLEARKVIERAKGVLMQRLSIGEEIAYKKMQRASQDENRRMRDIAESILSAERMYADPPA